MNEHLSFIIPAYNSAGTIEESVVSILDGNIEQDEEIVVVNDGSTDETALVLERLATKDSRIRIVNHPRNMGGGPARNTAAEHAQGDLIFCLDSDNVLAPGSIARLKAFRLATRADACAFRELRFFQTSPQDVTHKWRLQPGPVTLADCLAGGVVPPSSGNYLFTKSSWRQAGGYPESPLDTWGFGLRQLASGQRLVVMDDGFYCHRYGHASYWIRESRLKNFSLVAAELVMPFADLLAPGEIEYITGRRARLNWYQRLAKRPLRVLSGERGRTGVVLDLDGNEIPPARWSRAGIYLRLAQRWRAFRAQSAAN